jgi:hypothetical protein
MVVAVVLQGVVDFVFVLLVAVEANAALPDEEVHVAEVTRAAARVELLDL